MGWKGYPLSQCLVEILLTVESRCSTSSSCAQDIETHISQTSGFQRKDAIKKKKNSAHLPVFWVLFKFSMEWQCWFSKLHIKGVLFLFIQVALVLFCLCGTKRPPFSVMDLWWHLDTRAFGHHRKTSPRPLPYCS